MKADRIPPSIVLAVFNETEIEGLLEIAYLSAASSGDLSDEECEAFAELATRGRNVDTSPNALFRRFDVYDREAARVGRGTRLSTLGQLATSDEVRRAFYDAAEWVTWVDGNQCDAERDFLSELRSALTIA